MSEKRSKKSKNPMPKGKMIMKNYQPEENEEENGDFNSMIEQQLPQIPVPPPPPPPPFSKAFAKEQPRSKISKKGYEPNEAEDEDYPSFIEQRQERVVKMPPLSEDYSKKKARPRSGAKVKKQSYATEESQDDVFDLFGEQQEEEEQAVKMPPIQQRSKGRPKGKILKEYDSAEETEESEHYGPLLEQLEQKAMKMPPRRQEYTSKKGPPPMKQKPSKFASDPISYSPNMLNQRKMPQQYQYNFNAYDSNAYESEAYPNFDPFVDLETAPIPPIRITENLTDILQNKLQSPTVKDFKVNPSIEKIKKITSLSSRNISRNMLHRLQNSNVIRVHY